MENTLKIASMNCRGLGEFRKRRDVFHFLREKNLSVYLLQDTHFHPNLEDRIKAEWGDNAYFASYTTNARGVAILFNNNIEYKILDVTKDLNGNFLMIYLQMFDRNFLICNIYGPNDDNPDFYRNLEEKISLYGHIDNIITCGDWNLVMNFDLDCYNYRRRNNVEASEEVQNLMSIFNLSDVWRESNPDSKRYTWRRSTPFQQSRLDYYLISENLLPYVKNVDIKPGYRTDHSLITLTLELEKETKRNQFWKFNASLLHDLKYLEEINELILNVVAEYAAFPYNRANLKDIPASEIQFLISDQLILEVILMKLREKTILYSSNKNRLVQEKEKTLSSKIENFESKETLSQTEQDQLRESKEELVRIREHRMKGVLLRSRARWVQDGEKITSYFCSLEKRNYLNKSMNKLLLDNGEETTDKRIIIDEVKTFYNNLYSQRDVEDVAMSDLVNNIPSLSENVSNELEGELTLEEISESLKCMKNGKSPGSDGFTVEFFKVFWKQLGGYVLR